MGSRMWYSLMSILKALSRLRAASAPPGAGHSAAVSAGRRRAVPGPARRRRGSGRRTPCPGPPRGRQRRTQRCRQRRRGPRAAVRLRADLFSAQPPPPARQPPWQPRADASPPERRRGAGQPRLSRGVLSPLETASFGDPPPEAPMPLLPGLPSTTRPSGPSPASLSWSRWGPVSPTPFVHLKPCPPGCLYTEQPCAPLLLACVSVPHTPIPEPAFQD